jgi:hypothetical protein
MGEVYACLLGLSRLPRLSRLRAVDSAWSSISRLPICLCAAVGDHARFARLRFRLRESVHDEGQQFVHFGDGVTGEEAAGE